MSELWPVLFVWFQQGRQAQPGEVPDGRLQPAEGERRRVGIGSAAEDSVSQFQTQLFRQTAEIDLGGGGLWARVPIGQIGTAGGVPSFAVLCAEPASAAEGGTRALTDRAGRPPPIGSSGRISNEFSDRCPAVSDLSCDNRSPG